ncbi:MAG TPA: hypothetical protein VFZ08_13775 [Terriglobia bacterium]|nr:hypothetical protein [Terriglobia bacterium]
MIHDPQRVLALTQVRPGQLDFDNFCLDCSQPMMLRGGGLEKKKMSATSPSSSRSLMIL